MSKSTTITAAALLAVPVALLGACSQQQIATRQAPRRRHLPPPGTERMTTQLRTADGKPVANATLDFANGYATVTVETVAGGILTPGFHGLHIHSVGRCDANSVAPTGGAPADFASAGGHFEAPGQSGHSPQRRSGLSGSAAGRFGETCHHHQRDSLRPICAAPREPR